ncbi:MAG: DNA-3-methyladenine glycosylase [Rhodospirillaceae bacterium]|jgi:DNA-3-methyladenine glycosylase|nr:DNA-3-methyladenine glycosylase [Rhodospirillaceae bacterium]
MRHNIPELAGSIRRLARASLPVDTIALARFLIGKILVREMPTGWMSGRIVETEAYVVGDASGHAYRGQTPRNKSLFLETGHAYVYFAYGTSYLLNVSSEAAGVGAGVLIRAIEPIHGIPMMQKNRGVKRLLDLTRGPGRLAAALDIDRRLDGLDLFGGGPLWLGTDGQDAGAIGESTRIGITRETHRLLRFYIPGNRFVSGPRRLSP